MSDYYLYAGDAEHPEGEPWKLVAEFADRDAALAEAKRLEADHWVQVFAVLSGDCIYSHGHGEAANPDASAHSFLRGGEASGT